MNYAVSSDLQIARISHVIGLHSGLSSAEVSECTLSKGS